MKILVLVLAVAFVCIGNVPAQSWELGYEGEKIPDDPALGDDVWTVFGTSEICEITGAGELYINDPADKVGFFMRELEDGSVGTIEARGKVISQSGASYAILMGIENSDRAWLDLFPDHVQLEGGGSFEVDMTEYHVLRLTRNEADIAVYVDGELALEGSLGGVIDRTCIIFGSGSTGGTGEYYFDYVAYTTAGAFSPDELEDYLSTQAVESEGKLATCWGTIKSQQ